MRKNKDKHNKDDYDKDDYDKTYNHTYRENPSTLWKKIFTGKHIKVESLQQLMKSWGYPVILIVSAIITLTLKKSFTDKH